MSPNPQAAEEEGRDDRVPAPADSPKKRASVEFFNGVSSYYLSQESEALLSASSSLGSGANRRDVRYTLLDESLEELGTGPFQWKLLVITAFGAFIEASETSMISLLYPALMREWDLQEDDLAIVGSLTALGMLLGAVVFGQLSDRYGRKVVYQTSLTLCAFFAFCSSYAGNVDSFAVMRLGLGFGYGGNLMASTTLLVEYVERDKRSAFLSMAGVAFGVGSLCVTALAWWLIPLYGWRPLVRVAAALAVPVVVTLFFVPESVRFYVMRARHEEAVEALQVVARANQAPMPVYFSQQALDAALPQSRGGENGNMVPLRRNACGNFRRLLAKPVVVTLAPLSLVWFFHSVAINITQWVPTELETVYPSKHDVVYVVAMVQAIGGLFGCLVAWFAALRFRRLDMIRYGALLSGVCTVMMGILSSQITGLFTSVFALNVVEAASVLINALYIYSPEVFPTPIRVTAFGVCQTLHRLAPVLAPYIATSLDKVSFQVQCLVFGGFFLIAGAFSFALRVSTFGKPLVEEGDWDPAVDDLAQDD